MELVRIVIGLRPKQELMPYLIGLFLVLAIIFSAASGSSLLGNISSPLEIFGDVKDKITQTVFPKSQGEITIDNLKDSYQILDNFFSDTAQNISDIKGISPQDKTALEKAAATFQSSKDLVANLEQLQKEDKGLIQSAIGKILGLDKKSASLEPTSIPPQCKLVCD